MRKTIILLKTPVGQQEINMNGTPATQTKNLGPWNDSLLEDFNLSDNVHEGLVWCWTQIFRVSSEYERCFLSIFEHEHHWALDIRISSGTNIINSWNMCFKRSYHYVSNPQTYQKLQKVHLIRTSSEHEHTKNDNFELRASTNAHFSERERASIERFEVRHNTTMPTRGK